MNAVATDTQPLVELSWVPSPIGQRLNILPICLNNLVSHLKRKWYLLTVLRTVCLNMQEHRDRGIQVIIAGAEWSLRIYQVCVRQKLIYLC